ncbi:MAG TPA: hypothetical protein DCX06_05510 [Opitutae bacterium]|nr:hypothetical protein [Opitutae bacterium]
MKLLSATVRNYRTHRDTPVKLDDNLVLIHGPNESGKSTLAEAIHCALFLKAKGNTNFHKAMESNHGGTPEVELQFEAGGRVHDLRKTFGSSGNTTLDSEGQATLNGSAAEECLAGLLDVDGSVSGGGIETKMQKRWGHLWVRQGTSDATPLESIEESQSKLRDKLQASSGQSILSSPIDNTVIEALQTWEKSNLTNTGKAKANSDLDKAENALAAAKEAAKNVQATLEELHQAAKNYEQAESDIARHKKNKDDAEAELKTIDTKLKTVNTLREQSKGKIRQRETCEKELEELTDADAEIREFESQLKAQQTAAAPKQKEIKKLRTESKTKLGDYGKARKAREATSQSLSRLRSVADAWQAHYELLQKAKAISELMKQLDQIETLNASKKEINKQLAPLEDFTPDAVEQLEATERNAEEAKLKLEAYALQIEVLEANESIELDGQPLNKGQKEILSRTAELEIGSKTRIRLTPGGGEDLEDTRTACDEAAAALSKAIKKLGVDSVEAARAKARQRANLSNDLEKLEGKLEESNADENEDELAEAEKAQSQLQARRDTALPKDESVEFSDHLKDAEAASEEARLSLTEANQTYDKAESEETAARNASDKAAKSLTQAEAAHKQESEAILNMESKLEYARNKSGDTQTRINAINTAQAKFDQSKVAEESIIKQLDELGADELEIKAKRLKESVDKDAEKLKDANDLKIEARTELRSSGNQDPQREFKEAEAETDRFQKRYDQLKHQAEVRQHLLSRLQAARQATTSALAKPLEDAVNPYLKLLVGGSAARLHWAEDGSQLESLELDRTDKKKGLFTFENLSHGTREQVALALRLAMAQLLAADHDGCLPLVLDDAFTHADKDRLEKLKSLIYQASQSGLQILLLSCHPENYNGLSASEVNL